MDAVTEYFARHYTLVMDNDQGTYNEVRAAVQMITGESDITVSQYRAMSSTERMTEFGTTIGEKVLDLVEEWYLSAIEETTDTVGGMLIREIMITNGSEMAWALADHYMPEDSEADEFFGDDET